MPQSHFDDEQGDDYALKFDIIAKIQSTLDQTSPQQDTKYVAEFANGVNFTYRHFLTHGFRQPLRFRDKTGLKIRVPSRNISIHDIKRLVGSTRTLDVFDCRTQQAHTTSMKNFARYYSNADPNKQILNLISLEISGTRLDDYVEGPEFVSSGLDWSELAWPADARDVTFDACHNVVDFNYPKVQKYVLASVKGSYTDFHIDFCGSSVWYHIVKGKKVFWLAPPTDENLRVFERWQKSRDQNHIFLGDILTAPKCQLIELCEGDTFIIPSGWIHAVYTPEDSIVFGGNFLNSFSVDMQIKIMEMEERCRVNKRYRFPFLAKLINYVLLRYFYILSPEVYDIEKPIFKPIKTSALPKNTPGSPCQSQIVLNEQEYVSVRMLIDQYEKLLTPNSDTFQLMHDYDSNKFSMVMDSALLRTYAQTLKTKRSSINLKRSSHSNNSQLAGRTKSIRRVRCKKCEPCTREECNICIFCLDMKKNGGSGKLKQSCLSRKCIEPSLPKHCVCSICNVQNCPDFRLDLSVNNLNVDGLNFKALHECSTCFAITHPLCLYMKYRKFIENKIPAINEDIPSSWECFLCVHKIDNVDGYDKTTNLNNSTIQINNNLSLDISSEINFPSSKIELIEQIEHASDSMPSKVIIMPIPTVKPQESGKGCISVKRLKLEKK